MTTSTFNHSTPGLIAGTARTVLYGPAPAGTTVIIFSGVFANIDNTSMAQHWITLETKDSTGAIFTSKLNQVPIPFGGSSMCPKLVLLPGETLLVTADAANSVACSVELLLRQ